MGETLATGENHASLCYPSDFKEAAHDFDKIAWNFLELATGLEIPERIGVPHSPLVTVAGYSLRSFQTWRSQLPISKAGLGLRKVENSCYAAFIGAMEMSLPFLTGNKGLLRALEPSIGIIRGINHDRWRPLRESGSRIGLELLTAWQSLQEEA